MPALTDHDLLQLLEDDCKGGDLTTLTLGIGQRQGRFEFRARQPMCVCGIEEAVRMCRLVGLESNASAKSGDRLDTGQMILEAHGRADQLHRVWKSAQVLIEWASGIASAASEIVETAGGITVACTRKNVPGAKAISIKAVRAGGATMHRLGLSETLLVFPEHRLFLEERPEETIARLKRLQPEKKIVVEVADLGSAQIWGSAGADVLQLEKFSPEGLASCREELNRSGCFPIIAPAGGINAGNAAKYAAAGADMLITSAPFNAAPRDVTVRFFADRPDGPN